MSSLTKVFFGGGSGRKSRFSENLGNSGFILEITEISGFLSVTGISVRGKNPLIDISIDEGTVNATRSDLLGRYIISESLIFFPVLGHSPLCNGLVLI